MEFPDWVQAKINTIPNEINFGFKLLPNGPRVYIMLLRKA